jgi:PhzF family phenazine biosynthesis protein
MSDEKYVTIFQVDAFTDVPFKGNPAGVCVVDSPLDEAIMQNIAMEMNLSETAFVWPFTASDIRKSDKFYIRWFTPTCSAPLCGHATLAASKVLYDIFEVFSKNITFVSPNEELNVIRRRGYFQLNFPAADFELVELPDYIFGALRLDRLELGQDFLEACQSKNSQLLLLRFKSRQLIEAIAPDFYELYHAQDAFGCREVIVTCRGKDDYDFISRSFAPFLGIEEDPVSGAAHAMLGPYWGAMLDKQYLVGYQASKRGGKVIIELKKDPKGIDNRVLLSGNAVIVIEARLNLEAGNQ